MSSPSRPNWENGDGTGRYTALFSFEHLPIHTQTIGANASGVVGGFLLLGRGGSGASYLTSHDKHHHSFRLYFLFNGGFLIPFVFFLRIPSIWIF